MKILVTGGAGFIGSHIVDALISDGHEVSIIDDLSSGLKENVNSHARLYELDVRSEDAQKKIEEIQPEIIFHTAAQIDLRLSMENPVEDASVNILGSINILEGAKKAGTRKIIFSSTGGAMYGDTKNMPTDENNPEIPDAPYGIGKFTVEHYLRFYQSVYGVKSISLRYSNVYGPRQNSRGEAGVVAVFTTKLLRGENIIINGDGFQTRDYVYVSDVVRANMLAMKKEWSGAVNIATSKETDVNELAKLIEDAVGTKVEVTHGPQKKGEVRRSNLDFKKAAKILGWKPEVDIQKGIKKTVTWFQQEG